MTVFSRRTVLGVILPLATLVGCVKTTSDTGQNFVIDIARVNRDGAAIITVLSALLAIPAIDALLGPDLPAAEAALLAAQAAFATFQTLTKIPAATPVTSHSVIAAAQDLTTNAQTTLGLLREVAPKVPANLVTTVNNYVAAAQTLIPIVQLAVGTLEVKVEKPIMTESEALEIAKH